MATRNQSPTGEPAGGSRRPIYKTETTGDYWQDVWTAFKRISIVDDFQRIGEIPCARNSLLSGIASGAGVGVIRAMSASPFVASNWAVGTFMIISLGTWTVCQKNLEAERRRLTRVVEEMPKRYIKQTETAPKVDQEQDV
ncbi:hypothetical protein PAXRUDRAFT_151113 [Paxillus rubicundulus Ve08.2h10]|uniref:Cytochrome c oxidase assembly protein COX20, mitochondrial n=1 Tax=Paxillus rubicundulus Ve08.2h10 TaxID=930991 RepID=A0A0D0DIF4_9AGAM|nr:hypothetical protein PAXRUDRAFT_151113 [Paxillus rubicundulus Ve08.2h10]